MLHPKMALLIVYKKGIAMTASSPAYRIRLKNSKMQSCKSVVVVPLKKPSMLWTQADARLAQNCFQHPLIKYL